MPTYRNVKTGQVVVTEKPQPVFDRAARWERVEDDPKSRASRSRKKDQPADAGDK